MICIFKRHKKQSIVVGIILLVALLIVYLRALFLPGLWHRDAFLYWQDDGSFSGSDIYADYKMTITYFYYGADVDFSVNDVTKHYQIKYDNNDLNRNVEILENGNTVFKGNAFGSGDGWMLLDENHEMVDGIIVYTGNYVPAEDELFPGYTKLYNWAVSDKTNTRGEPYVLLLVLLFGVILFLDIKFPDLFWLLEHRLDVDGGEPSEWYRFSQKIGRVVLSAGVLICIILTFTLH